VNIYRVKIKVIAVLITVLSVVMLGQIMVTSPMLADHDLKATMQAQKDLAEHIAIDLEANLNRAKRQLEIAAGLPAIASMEPERITPNLSWLTRLSGTFNDCLITDTTGKTICRSGSKAYPVAQESILKALETGRTACLGIRYDSTGWPISGFATPITDASGNPMGAVAGILALSQTSCIQSAIRQTSNRRITAYIVSGDGGLLAHPTCSRAADNHSLATISAPFPLENLAPRQSGTVTYQHRNTAYVAAFHPVPSTGWRVVVHQPKASIMARSQQNALLITEFFAVAFLISAMIVGFVIQYTLKPLSRLVRAIEAGKIDPQPVYPRDEIGQIARKFDQLYSNLYQSKTALEESEQRYRLLVENQSDLLIKFDLDGHFLFVSPSYCTLFGRTEDELLGKKILPLLHKDDREAARQALDKLQRSPNDAYLEQRVTTHAGRRWIAWLGTAMRDENQQITGIVAVGRDITERKEVEAALKASEEQLQLIVQASPIGITITQEGRFVYANPSFLRMFGFKNENDVRGCELNALYSPENRETLTRRREAVLDGREKLADLEARGKKQDGTLFDLKLWLTQIPYNDRPAVLCFVIDVSLENKLRAQLNVAQKMESIGTLAGGVAHDFNNLLMGMEGNISLALLKMDPSDPQYSRLKNVEEYIQNGAELTKQLLGFARGGKYETRATDIRELVEKTAGMFGRTRKEITIHSVYPKDLWTTEADAGQVEQVFLNLFINAWQAMPGGGELNIEAENIMLAPADAQGYGIRPGRYIKISVTDTGIGIPSDIQSKIFDPFFTTKGRGRGVGLGLASAYGIIKNHGGSITVYSEQGMGATFNVYLPRSGKKVVQEKEVAETILTGSETILLVDDEEMILDVGREMLEHLGYHAIIAGSGKEAIRIFSEQQDRIALVIQDMIMPDMGGGEVFDRIRQIRPDARVLLSSGYSINGKAAEILNRGCNGFIQKPFNIKKLSQKIREILDPPAADRN